MDCCTYVCLQSFQAGCQLSLWERRPLGGHPCSELSQT
jgi:hypothetical protein